MENYTWYLLVRNMNNISSRRTFQLLIESAGRPRRLNSTINIIGGLADYNGDFLVLIVVINSRDVLPIHSRTGLVYKRTYPPVYDTTDSYALCSCEIEKIAETHLGNETGACDTNTKIAPATYGGGENVCIRNIHSSIGYIPGN